MANPVQPISSNTAAPSPTAIPSRTSSILSVAVTMPGRNAGEVEASAASVAIHSSGAVKERDRVPPEGDARPQCAAQEIAKAGLPPNQSRQQNAADTRTCEHGDHRVGEARINHYGPRYSTTTSDRDGRASPRDRERQAEVDRYWMPHDESPGARHDALL